MNQTFFHIVFVLLFLAFTVIRMYYHRKAEQAKGKVEYKEGKLHVGVRKLIGVPFMLGLFTYMFIPRLFAWAEFPLPGWAQFAGVAFGVTSILLIGWVQWALGANFSTTLHVREEHTLVTHGPYRWVRHPMYSVLFLFEIAILLLTRNWFIGGVPLVALTLIVLTRLENEEAAMIEKFGDAYRSYMACTGRFLPRFSVRLLSSRQAA
jgi:protein-S-isoprenylcysteine O-methyltransferase Ste14